MDIRRGMVINIMEMEVMGAMEHSRISTSMAKITTNMITQMATKIITMITNNIKTIRRHSNTKSNSRTIKTIITNIMSKSNILGKHYHNIHSNIISSVEISKEPIEVTDFRLP